MIINVKETGIGKRIDSYLAENTEFSRAHIQKMAKKLKFHIRYKKMIKSK